MQIDAKIKRIQPTKPARERTDSNRRFHLGRPLLHPLIAVLFVLGCGGNQQSKSTSSDKTTDSESTSIKSQRVDRHTTPTGSQRKTETVVSKTHTGGPSQAAKTTPTTPIGKTPKSPTSPLSKPPPKPAPQQVYRPNDDRPKHDDARLASFGVRRFESKRLVLYTDIPAETATRLVGVVDPLYPAWTEYFGPLPPARDGSEFQVTGYIMTEREKFRRLGLIPGDLRPFINGRHRRYEFWMLDQKTDYYRRHLILHEATHCFMTILEHESNVPEVWYLEGMAELFGTHHFDASGKRTSASCRTTRPTSPALVAFASSRMLSRRTRRFR